MDLLTIVTLLIFISAAFSYLNERFVKLPGTIGVITLSVLVSIVLLIAGKNSNALAKTISNFTYTFDFSKVLLDVMLGFLLFANAIHFDNKKLKEQRLPVLILSTIGVIVSTSVFGGLFYCLAQLLGNDIPLIYCFLMGALISPTDPITVASILQNSKIPIRLRTIISGESLFNDGIGLMIFVILLDITTPPLEAITFKWVMTLFVQEIIGGIGIGLVIGYLGYRLMKSVNDFQTILLISISLVLGIAVVADYFHASIPLASVTAGLIVSSKSLDKGFSTNQFLGRIWKLIDEVLNTIVFVMIGLQLVAMPFLYGHWLIGLFSILILLVARLASVFLTAVFLLRKVDFSNLAILTWAGLRGGISIAMALSLPPSPYRETILSSCYFIVIFSIIVQGLTLNKVVELIVNHSAGNKKSKL